MKMFFQNKKTKGIYKVLYEEAINCTNAQDGQIMVIYTNGKEVFVREQKEFQEKFDVYSTLSEKEVKNEEKRSE